MNNILSSFPDVKDFMETQKFCESVSDEKAFHLTTHSISKKMAKHIFFQNSIINKSESTSGRKNSSHSNSYAIPEVIGQITTRYMTSFMDFLLQKFKSELQFYTANATILSRLQNDPNIASARLSLIRNILSFDSFNLLLRKENPSFYRTETLIARFESMTTLLDDIVQVLKKDNPTRPLVFFDENECQKCLIKYIPGRFFENEYFLKVCSEFWRFIRNLKYAEPSELNTQAAFDNLTLFLYGISFPSFYAEDYPLHHAVYTSNLAMVRRICAREKSPVFHAHIEQSDPIGITPLMLAVLLGNKDAVLILTNHGAHPKHRSYPYARTPLEEAIHKKNRSMVKVLLLASIYAKQANWEDNKKPLIDFLVKVPDFSFEMSWECDSKIIPFVKKVAPSDTYKVYKRGSSIRIDLSLLGWSKLKSIRGNSSIIFNGSGLEEGRLMMIDHIKKASVDILGDMNSLELENKVDELIKHEQMNSEIKAENVVFKPATTWKGELVKTQVNGFDCVKCISKGTFSLLFTRRNILVDIEAKQFASFEQYFEHVVQEPLWILEDSEGHIDWNQSPLLKISQYAESYQAVVKTLFEKEGKENANGISANNIKGRKDTEKMNISQKKLLKHYTKNIVATIYMCENFPLNLEHFFPILEILSNVSPHINRLKGFLEKTLSINKTSFPIKACIPIFFSLNAILSMKDFKFISPEASLFDLELLLQRTAKKVPDYVYRDERFRTEGGSDDEHVQQRWQELLKHDSDSEVVSYTSAKYKFRNLEINEDDEENEEDDENAQQGALERSERFIQSFFNKSKVSTVNRDFVNVFASEFESKEVRIERKQEENTEENLEDLGDFDAFDDFEEFEEMEDISEKYRNETLKLSSHKTHAPKTIMSIQKKYGHSTENGNSLMNDVLNPNGYGRGVMAIGNISLCSALQNKNMQDNIHHLKGKNNYKFMDNLKGRISKREMKIIRSRKESLSSRNFNEMEFSQNNSKEMQMKKLAKYTIKKQNLLSKGAPMNQKIYKDEPQIHHSIAPKAPSDHNEMKITRKVKHERIKSLDVPNKDNFETFFETLWKPNN